MTVQESITLAIAVLGATLGILNTWYNFDKSRVKLRVIPKHAMPFGGADPRLTFCIEIVNLSAFDLTIEEAGVQYRGERSRGAIIRPVFLNGGSWPQKLPSRSSLTMYAQSPFDRSRPMITCAYARTACGVVATGNSPALRQMAAGTNF